MNELEITPSRTTMVGNMPVRRALPRRGHRTVGAWCFADHMGPAQVTKEHGLDIGPHPHTGLQTVTYLVDGEALHRDSLGNEQLIAPGQLNLMTAGLGVSHSEEATRRYEGSLQGIQLWIAQTERTRLLEAAFEHHGELPRIESSGAVATVLVGNFCGVTSPARLDSDLVGVEVRVSGSVNYPLRPDFEYALIALEGSLMANGHVIEPGHIGYLGVGHDEIDFESLEPSSLMVLGGVPLESEILMWWNFVARNRDEIDSAFQAWLDDDGRFGTVASTLARITVAPPFWHAPR